MCDGDPGAFFSFFDGEAPGRAEPAVDAFIAQHVESRPAPSAPSPDAEPRKGAHANSRDPPRVVMDASPDMIHPLIRGRRLDTPEDIAQWIAERKRRYPTEANVKMKAAAAAAGSKRAHAEATSPLAALASYGADSDSGADSDAASSGSAPDEAPAKVACRAPFRPSGMAPDEDRRKLRVCRFFARGNCRQGAACPFAHPPSMREADKDAPSEKPRATLLEMLMAKDVERENYRVLQCIEYIVEQDFLGVPVCHRVSRHT